ncbi:TonB-dependent receptor plug domain-containing protein [Sphingomonas sp. UNC305MFCol5.2]|uniref:TonB-dependent receptor plug domain-containing protein n=1 Tax=Sphingomonas sp. UNC305MFCol5.2 TaxID=1449076 RepID=UPI0003FD824C|nr:TonB-dependent receptor [Sphingomonas sp. UNC305MFCol5.2]
MKHTQFARLRGSSALSALVLAGTLFAAPAFAQDASTPGQTQVDAQTDDAQDSGDIVVTGTLFRRTDTETASPVTVVTSETLSRAGTTTIADAIRQVSADSAGSIPTGFQGGFSAGGSAVSLRGLGVSSTLVLIDGLRSAAFPLNDDGHNSYTDLNSIPFSIVDRVEVLKDGASSTYGAEAIGGVVNVILKKQFTGVAGTVEGGVAEGGYGARYRGNLTAGFGDYEATGWNLYVNGEYQQDRRISVQDVGFPFNTTDLSSIGLIDNNTADSALSTPTINAVVRRTTQSDLNNPFTGGVAASGLYTTLNLSNCPGNTYTVAGASGGVGCRHDNTYEFSQVQPFQERFSVNGRLSIRLTDDIEAYVLGSYSHSQVNIKGTPPGIRQRQPYGAPPSAASNNPGIVLPYYVCAAGVNCITAADRRLNPNNPYATVNGADAATAAANAARIYYLFGDIRTGTERGNEVIRGAIGFNGSFGEKTHWRVEAVGARDNLELNAFGVINIAGLKQAVNTGAYNFINPSANTDAVRQMVAPNITNRATTSLASLDASITHEFFELPGGPLQVAVGGQIRRETLDNPGLNPNRENYANTAAAFGAHTVTAGYFEISAPVLPILELSGSGRYDHYSEGFSRFSPKVGAKFTPIREVAIRGTYSQGFRAPTFAESNPRSSFPGFVTFTPPASFQIAHGGLISGGNTNPYAQSYSVGGGFSGNPNLKPETSRAFTGGIVVEPTRGVSITVDYYNIKKNDVIVAGPDAGAARAAYFAGQPLPAGYTVGAVDAIDPLFPNALPRVLVINGPYVNAGYFKTEGLDFSASLDLPITDGVRFVSRLDVNKILKFDVDFGDGTTRPYVGTLGPYELSSGAGTPEWRGNWQNTLELGDFSISATTYYVSRIKAVAADEVEPDANGDLDLSCDQNLYGTGEDACYIKRFIYADLNMTYKVNDNFTFYMNVGNFTNERAPIAPASYSGVNYLPTWHFPGVIGRTFRAGASFKF